MNQNKLVLLDISNVAVRALLLQKKDKDLGISKAKTVLINKETGLAGALASLFTEFPKENIVGLFPREKCVFRDLVVKEHTVKALNEAVESEIQEGLHLNRENTAYAAVLSSEKGKGVLCAASLKDVKEYFAPLEKINAFPVAVIPTTAVLLEAFKKSPVFSKESSLIVSVLNGRADILAVRDSMVVLSRGVLVPAGGISETINDTQEALSRKGIVSGRVVYSGEQVKDGIHLLPSPQFSKESGTEKEAGDWLAIYGLYLLVTGEGGLDFDILKNVAGTNTAVPVYIKVLRAAAIIATALLLVGGVFHVMNGCASKKLEDIKTELSGLEVSGGKKWAGVVTEIMNAVPNEIVLNELTGDTKGEINVKGSAKARKDVSVFIDNLNGIKGLVSELAFANETPVSGGQVTQFMIKIRVRGGGVEK